MDSDRLGRLGELWFEEVCTSAGLICNASSRDRAGWDYVIDFPHAASAKSLDHRTGPRCCLIQVKSIKDGKTSVRLRLDMAERLAKDIRPTFVVVPVYRGEVFADVYVLQVRGQHLETILKKLRKTERDGAGLVKKTYVHLKLRACDRLASTRGQELRAAFEAACPEGMEEYAQDKARERSRAGYAENAFRSTFTLAAKSPDELMDIMMGTIGDVPVELGEIVETRFGVTLPHLPAGKALMSIDALAKQHGTIRLYGSGGLTPFVTRAEFNALPFEISGHRRFVWGSRQLRVQATTRPNNGLDITVTCIAEDIPWTLADWATHAKLRFFLNDSLSRVECDIISEGQPSTLLQAPCGRVVGTSTDDLAEFRKMAELAGFLVELASRAGLDLAGSIEQDAYDAALADILPLFELERDNIVVLSGNIDAAKKTHALVVGRIKINSEQVLWHGFLQIGSDKERQPVMHTLTSWSAERVGPHRSYEQLRDALLARYPDELKCEVGWVGDEVRFTALRALR